MDGSTPILPTNTCFDDCLDYIEHIIKTNLPNIESLLDRYWVVHGIYQLTDLENDTNTNGEPFAHGWVFDRHDNSVIQDGYLNGDRITYSITLTEFYELFKVIDETRYTLKEVHRLNILHNNYGPWKASYIKHCKNSHST